MKRESNSPEPTADAAAVCGTASPAPETTPCDYCDDPHGYRIPGGVSACESCFYYVLDDNNYPAN